MKFPTVRNTTALGEKDGFAFYQNNQNAIKDFFFYLSYFGYKTDYGGDLFKFVWEMKENAYFEEDFNAYYKKVSGVYFQLFSKE